MLNRAYVGRRVAVTPPVTVTGPAVSAFAESLGDVVTDGVAPPTFLVSITMPAVESLKDDPDFGLDYAKVLHREQSFDFVRPVRVGDTITCAIDIDAIKTVAGNDILSLRAEVRDDGGQMVATVTTILFVAGDEQ
ncbi:MAG: FAS1-like dehydratase domain-containing protein [Stackebrandtia sp.]